MLKRILALPGQTVCRTDRAIAVDGIAMGNALDRDQPRPTASRLAGLPAHSYRRSLPDELAVRGLPRRPVFWPAPVTTIVGRADPLWTREED